MDGNLFVAALRSLPPSNRLLACNAAAAAAAALKNPLFLFAFAAPIHSTLTPSLPPSTNFLPTDRPPRPTDVIIIKWRGKNDFELV